MDLNVAIQNLFPTAVQGVDFVTQDDGAGPYIKVWNLKSPQPSDSQLSTAYTTAVASPAYLAKRFNVNQFVEELMVAFQADANMLLYYAPVKDLASFGNFYGLNVLVQGLLAATKITTQEVAALNTVLAKQNIVLSAFTTPPS
jgi:hypothetical protein